MPREKINELVFRAMALLNAAKGESGFDQLDEDCQNLLFYIGNRNAMGNKVIVSDLVGPEKFGSFPTVQKRLGQLADNGWLALRKDPDDGRAMVLEVTPLAIRAFNRMSSTLQRFSTVLTLQTSGK